MTITKPLLPWLQALEPRLQCSFSPGGLDPSFADAGRTLVESLVPVSAASGGRVIAATNGKTLWIGVGDRGLSRLNADGSPDPTFGDRGKLDLRPYGGDGAIVNVAPDGRIVLVSSDASDPSHPRISRLNANGSPDLSFAPGGTRVVDVPAIVGSYASVVSTAVDAQGRILLLGRNDYNDFAVARLRASDGALDSAFSGDGMFDIERAGDQFPGVLAVQPDGRVLVSTLYSGEVLFTRLNVDGTQDLSFGGNGTGYATLPAGGTTPFNGITAITFDNANRIVVAGTMGFGSALGVVARFDANGGRDLSFGSNGSRTFSLFGSNGATAINSISVDANDRIYAVGRGSERFAIARLTATGNVDNSFDADGRLHPYNADANAVASAVFVDATGRLLVSGTDLGQPVLLALNAGGVRDTSFNATGELRLATAHTFGTSDAPVAICRQADGKLLVLTSYFSVTRLNADGSVDRGFGYEGDATVTTGAIGGAPSDLVVDDAHGVIYALGTNGLFRLNANGSIDATFGAGGKATLPNALNYYAKALALDAARGRLYVSGRSSTLAAFTLTGLADTAFAGTGALVLPQGNGSDSYGLALAPNGDVLARSGGTVARVHPDGTPDASFGTNGSVDFIDYGKLVAVDAGGRVYVGTTTYKPGGGLYDYAFAITRLASTGQPDASFGSNGVAIVDLARTSFLEEPRSIAFAPDGSLYASAVILPYGSGSGSAPFPGSAIVHLDAAGHPVASFGTNGAVVASVADALTFDGGLLIDPVGRLVTAGTARVVRQPDAFNTDVVIARLNGSAPIPGDANGDGAVNFDDLLILAQNYGATGRTFAQGNFDRSADGSVGFDEMLLLAQHYGDTLYSLPVSDVVAPSKPATRRRP